MNILDIAIAKKLAGGGGGSGTDNYNDLSNLPKINDTTLSGNKSSSALGLQSEINSDSKLASDLVDDTNQDNKFVTSTEKNTWNAKQNAIDSDHKLSSDLVDDANKTNKFVTSTEKQTWNAKQNAIDADHKLSSSLVSFTEAEDAALASGINSSKVGQISTNQTNILYALNRTGKNYLPTTSDPSKTSNRVTFTVNDDGTVSVSTTSEGASASTSFLYTGGYVKNAYAGLMISGAPVGSTSEFCIYIAYSDDGSSQAGAAARVYEGNPTYTITNEHPYIGIFIVVPQGLISTSAKIFKIMVSEPDMYALDPSYVPYALPNYDLTRLEAEDRASLAEVVDSGAKNLCTNSSITSLIGEGFSDVSWFSEPIPAGTYVLRAKITSAKASQIMLVNTSNIELAILTPAAPSGTNADYISNPFTITEKAYGFRIYSNAAPTTWTDIMICTKAAFGVSQKFVPYTMKQPRIIYLNDSPTLSTTETIVANLSYTIPTNTTARITVTQTYNSSIPTAIRIAWDNAMISNHSYEYKENSNNLGGLSVSTMIRVGNMPTTIYVSAKAAQSGVNNMLMLIELFE